MAVSFTPVETKRVYDAVFERIENMILTGQLKPGDKLPSERELMRIYKTSHPTIREALRMLESSNYIRVVPGGGAEVCYSSTDSMEDSITELLQFRRVSMTDICQFVRLSEAAFISKAAQRFVWEDLVALEQVCGEMEACQDDPVAYSARMSAFHVKLMKATRNPLLYVFWKCMGEFWQPEELEQYRDRIVIGDMGRLQDCHRQLVEAVKAKDTDGMARLVRACWQEWQLSDGGKGARGA